MQLQKATFIFHGDKIMFSTLFVVLGAKGVASSFKIVQRKQTIFKLGIASVNFPEGRITRGQDFMIHCKTNK